MTLPPKQTILVVDDVPANLELLSNLLSTRGYRVRSALSGAVALKSVHAAPPDLILLDINMPEMDGYEVCQQLKAEGQTSAIPVIFISALNETLDKVRAFKVGGVDYITKPFQFEEVLARVEAHLTLYYQRREIEMLHEREKARFAELNTVKDQFVQMVSHDLKNPLTAVMGYAYLIEEEQAWASPEDLLEFTKSIQVSAQKMLRLITDLLDLGRIEAGMELQLVPVTLTDFLTQHLLDHQALAHHKQIDLALTLPLVELTLPLDITRFGQVIDNLLSNAIKYTPEGGHVALAAQVTPGEVILQVADNGLGIPTEDIPHLFDKFYRVQRSKHLTAEGTGLGLAIVKAIVEQHGGHIWVESELNEGSIFNVALPRSA